MNNYNIISFYSDPINSNYYMQNYKRLKTELDTISLPYHIEHLQTQKNYMENCLQKPRFILEKIQQLNTPVLWMDIDCIIKEFPHDFINNDYDICVSIRERRVTKEIIPESCFVYFNNTKESINFIEDWVTASERATRDLDHLIMIDLYNYYKKYKTIKIKEFDWFYASPLGLPNVKILMGNSKTETKRHIEHSIRTKGRE